MSTCSSRPSISPHTGRASRARAAINNNIGLSPILFKTLVSCHLILSHLLPHRTYMLATLRRLADLYPIAYETHHLLFINFIVIFLVYSPFRAICPNLLTKVTMLSSPRLIFDFWRRAHIGVIACHIHIHSDIVLFSSIDTLPWNLPRMTENCTHRIGFTTKPTDSFKNDKRQEHSLLNVLHATTANINPSKSFYYVTFPSLRLSFIWICTWPDTFPFTAHFCFLKRSSGLTVPRFSFYLVVQ